MVAQSQGAGELSLTTAYGAAVDSSLFAVVYPDQMYMICTTVSRPSYMSRFNLIGFALILIF